MDAELVIFPAVPSSSAISSSLLRIGFALWFGGGCWLSSSPAQRPSLAWPTANHAYAEGRPLEDYIQPTSSGRVESGLFGCVRNGGARFHEALDLLPISRDRRGEATDEVYAVLEGVVRHVNPRSGASSYGRYIVLEHPEAEPAFYSLYAHMATIDEAITPGARVATAQVLGIMGRSAGGYTIPRERAHLHFEIGLRLTDDFQSWYDAKKFGSANDHGPWNGMNLLGVDPLAFFDAFRAQEVDTVADFVRGLQPAVRVRVATRKEPDFLQRYPQLRTDHVPWTEIEGWEISFDRYAMPFAWRPLRLAEVKGIKAGEAKVVWADRAEIKACRCRDLVRTRWGKQVPIGDLERSLQLLFGWKP